MIGQDVWGSLCVNTEQKGAGRGYKHTQHSEHTNRREGDDERMRESEREQNKHLYKENR